MNLKRKFNRVPKVFLVLVALLIVFRIFLPNIVRWYVNKTLSEIPGYYGRVEDVDISLWRGAYQIERMKFMKVNNKIREPYFYAELIDISIDWKALFNGKIATKIEMEHPEFTLVQGATAETTQVKVDKKWQDQVQKLYPFEINSFIVHDGKVRFKNNATKPKIDVNLSKLEGEAANLTNANHKEANLFSTIKAKAQIQKTGRMNVSMKLNPFAEPLVADFDGKIEGLDLVEVNDFAKAYGNFDFEKGKASLYIEAVTEKNAFTGYTKLLMEKVDVLDWSNEKGDSFLHKIWEGLVGAGFEILQNQGKDQFALRAPLAGKLDDIKVDGWKTFWSIVRNAFVEALPKKLENSFNFKTLEKLPKDEKK